ncbi:MAG: hypothetical protein H6600_09545 [Flavobacteriales bacterium]|nr:hypothetical protein [Flavobacteriales bacterium]MCB9198693.1 hypothetical protein [Flavobacteriales bacterium]
MTILRNNESETPITYLGLAMISLALILFFVGNYIPGVVFLMLGIIVTSITKKVAVNSKEKEAIVFFSVFNFRIPVFNTKINLEDFCKATLYQYSEKGTMTFRTQSLNHQQREFWIRLEAKDGSQKSLGYLNSYEIGKQLLQEFQTVLNYTIQDRIQERIKQNKIEREKRTRK